MRTLVDEYIGNYRSNLTVILMAYPLREIRISINSTTISDDDLLVIIDKLNSVYNFVKNDPDPWNSMYG